MIFFYDVLLVYERKGRNIRLVCKIKYYLKIFINGFFLYELKLLLIKLRIVN